jgi:hypothetical protein
VSTVTTKAAPRGRALAALAFGALGVVYGDIGTSPLYALKECFGGLHTSPTRENVIGVMSLVSGPSTSSPLTTCFSRQPARGTWRCLPGAPLAVAGGAHQLGSGGAAPW